MHYDDVDVNSNFIATTRQSVSSVFAMKRGGIKMAKNYWLRIDNS